IHAITNIGLYGNGGVLDVNGCTFSGNPTWDIYLVNTTNVTGSVHDSTAISNVYYAGLFPSVTWTNNTFVNYGVRESVIPPDAFGNFSCDNTFSGATGFRTQIYGGTVLHDQTWCTKAGIVAATGLLEVQGSTAAASSTLTIQPGL